MGLQCGGDRLAKSVHGGFNSKNLFVTLLILDVLPHEPLELVGEELFELMDICMSEANVVWCCSLSHHQIWIVAVQQPNGSHHIFIFDSL